MMSQVLSNFHLKELTVVAFLIFLSFFLFVLYWTFRKGTTQLYKEVENIPFEDSLKKGELK